MSIKKKFGEKVPEGRGSHSEQNSPIHVRLHSCDTRAVSERDFFFSAVFCTLAFRAGVVKRLTGSLCSVLDGHCLIDGHTPRGQADSASSHLISSHLV